MTTDRGTNLNIQALHEVSDTFHDFGKGANDVRCKLNDVSNREFHSTALNKLYGSGLSVIHPHNLKFTANSYEDKAIAFLKQVSQVPLHDTGCDVLRTAEENENLLKTLTHTDAKLGIIYDQGSSVKDLFDDPTSPSSKSFNLMTIAGSWDEAYKRKDNSIVINVAPIPSSTNNAMKIHNRDGQLGMLYDDLIQFKFEKNQDAYENYVVIKVPIPNGELKLHHSVLYNNIMQLSVANLCNIIDKLSISSNGVEFNSPSPGSDVLPLLVSLLLSTNLAKYKITFEGTFNKESSKDYRDTIIEVLTSQIKSSNISFFYDLKRSMDYGQVKLAQYLGSEKGKIQPIVYCKSDTMYRFIPDALKANMDMCKQFMVVTGDKLCYTKAKIEKVNALQQKGSRMCNIYTTGVVDFEKALTSLQKNIDSLEKRTSELFQHYNKENAENNMSFLRRYINFYDPDKFFEFTTRIPLDHVRQKMIDVAHLPLKNTCVLFRNMMTELYNFLLLLRHVKWEPFCTSLIWKDNYLRAKLSREINDAIEAQTRNDNPNTAVTVTNMRNYMHAIKEYVLGSKTLSFHPEKKVMFSKEEIPANILSIVYDICLTSFSRLRSMFDLFEMLFCSPELTKQCVQRQTGLSERKMELKKEVTTFCTNVKADFNLAKQKRCLIKKNGNTTILHEAEKNVYRIEVATDLSEKQQLYHYIQYHNTIERFQTGMIIVNGKPPKLEDENGYDPPSDAVVSQSIEDIGNSLEAIVKKFSFDGRSLDEMISNLKNLIIHPNNNNLLKLISNISFLHTGGKIDIAAKIKKFIAAFEELESEDKLMEPLNINSNDITIPQTTNFKYKDIKLHPLPLAIMNCIGCNTSGLDGIVSYYIMDKTIPGEVYNRPALLGQEAPADKTDLVFNIPVSYSTTFKCIGNMLSIVGETALREGVKFEIFSFARVLKIMFVEFCNLMSRVYSIKTNIVESIDSFDVNTLDDLVETYIPRVHSVPLPQNNYVLMQAELETEGLKIVEDPATAKKIEEKLVIMNTSKHVKARRHKILNVIERYKGAFIPRSDEDPVGLLGYEEIITGKTKRTLEPIWEADIVIGHFDVPLKANQVTKETTCNGKKRSVRLQKAGHERHYILRWLGFEDYDYRGTSIEAEAGMGKFGCDKQYKDVFMDIYNDYYRKSQLDKNGQPTNANIQDQTDDFQITYLTDVECFDSEFEDAPPTIRVKVKGQDVYRRVVKIYQNVTYTSKATMVTEKIDIEYPNDNAPQTSNLAAHILYNDVYDGLYDDGAEAALKASVEELLTPKEGISPKPEAFQGEAVYNAYLLILEQEEDRENILKENNTERIFVSYQQILHHIIELKKTPNQTKLHDWNTLGRALNDFDAIQCETCQRFDNEDEIIICSLCERAWHRTCLNMKNHPEEADWYCSTCTDDVDPEIRAIKCYICGLSTAPADNPFLLCDYVGPPATQSGAGKRKTRYDQTRPKINPACKQPACEPCNRGCHLRCWDPNKEFPKDEWYCILHQNHQQQQSLNAHVENKGTTSNHKRRKIEVEDSQDEPPEHQASPMNTNVQEDNTFMNAEEDFSQIEDVFENAKEEQMNVNSREHHDVSPAIKPMKFRSLREKRLKPAAMNENRCGKNSKSNTTGIEKVEQRLYEYYNPEVDEDSICLICCSPISTPKNPIYFCEHEYQTIVTKGGETKTVYCQNGYHLKCLQGAVDKDIRYHPQQTTTKTLPETLLKLEQAKIMPKPSRKSDKWFCPFHFDPSKQTKKGGTIALPSPVKNSPSSSSVTPVEYVIFPHYNDLKRYCDEKSFATLNNTMIRYLNYLAKAEEELEPVNLIAEAEKQQTKSLANLQTFDTEKIEKLFICTETSRCTFDVNLALGIDQTPTDAIKKYFTIEGDVLSDFYRFQPAPKAEGDYDWSNIKTNQYRRIHEEEVFAECVQTLFNGCTETGNELISMSYENRLALYRNILSRAENAQAVLATKSQTMNKLTNKTTSKGFSLLPAANRAVPASAAGGARYQKYSFFSDSLRSNLYKQMLRHLSTKAASRKACETFF